MAGSQENRENKELRLKLILRNDAEKYARAKEGLQLVREACGFVPATQMGVWALLPLCGDLEQLDPTLKRPYLRWSKQ